MLRDVIEFVRARTDLTREAALREINWAFKEFYAADDFPNSLYETTVVPNTVSSSISLPWYVGTIRAVKQNYSKNRVTLNTPRPYYQDETYWQSPFTWRVLGKNSLKASITNATTLVISIAAAEAARFTVTLAGPTDNAAETSEAVVFEIGDETHTTIARFTDAYITKDAVTENNIIVTNSAGVEVATIPNSQLDGLNTIIAILDKGVLVNSIAPYNAFDILYKQTTPILSADGTYIPNEAALMQLVMEWITMAKEGGQTRAAAFNAKATQLATIGNNDDISIEKKLDLGRGQFITGYSGKF